MVTCAAAAKMIIWYTTRLYLIYKNNGGEKKKSRFFFFTNSEPRAHCAAARSVRLGDVIDKYICIIYRVPQQSDRREKSRRGAREIERRSI